MALKLVYANKFENIEKMFKFLGQYNFPEVSQGEIDISTNMK